jgi:hypothetical protein
MWDPCRNLPTRITRETKYLNMHHYTHRLGETCQLTCLAKQGYRSHMKGSLTLYWTRLHDTSSEPTSLDFHRYIFREVPKLSVSLVNGNIPFFITCTYFSLYIALSPSTISDLALFNSQNWCIEQRFTNSFLTATNCMTLQCEMKNEDRRSRKHNFSLDVLLHET